MKRAGITIFIIAVIIVVVGLVMWATSGTQMPEQNAEIVSFDVDQPNFVIEARDVARVDVFGVPSDVQRATTTDTVATTSEDILIGEADPVGPPNENGVREWRLPVPSEPLQISAVYAQGYNADGETVARKALSALGPRGIYEALWSDGGASTESIGVGETVEIQDGNMTLQNIGEDNRCRREAQCPEPGGVTATFTLTPEDGQQREVTINSADEQTSVDSYILDILEVEPERPMEGEIARDEYSLRVLVFKEAKL